VLKKPLIHTYFPPRKQHVGDLDHLALDTRCRERFSASCPVVDCERGSVALLERREGVARIEHGSESERTEIKMQVTGPILRRRRQVCGPVGGCMWKQGVRACDREGDGSGPYVDELLYREW